MNPESQIPQPSPENDHDRGCGVSPQAVQGASRSESTAQETEKDSSNLLTPLITDLPPAMPSTAEPGSSEFANAHTAFRSLGTSHSPSFDDMGFVYPPEMPAEPDYDGDYDYEDDAREHELLMEDLADDNDDFARSDDEGWFYSDED